MHYAEILDFWFQGVTDQTPIRKNQEPFKLWFMASRRFDELVRLRFEETLLNAADGRCQSWESDPRGRLALILLFDQFSRNIYRNTQQMYAYDPLALELTLDMLAAGEDRQLALIQRIFVYMPLTHSENLDHQRLCVAQFNGLIEESQKRQPANTPYFEYHLKYVKDYTATIEKFGRFPHRNALLQRKSTPEEIDSLNKKL